jgi:hypothetical protein
VVVAEVAAVVAAVVVTTVASGNAPAAAALLTTVSTIKGSDEFAGLRDLAAAEAAAARCLAGVEKAEAEVEVEAAKDKGRRWREGGGGALDSTTGLFAPRDLDAPICRDFRW